ncbi:MAG: hypothetical protein IPG60_05790 [Bacteroidetes bacterium]|nr:hypothetical protein [Bacteroidota bacterium]
MKLLLNSQKIIGLKIRVVKAIRAQAGIIIHPVLNLPTEVALLLLLLLHPLIVVEVHQEEEVVVVHLQEVPEVEAEDKV